MQNEWHTGSIHCKVLRSKTDLKHSLIPSDLVFHCVLDLDSFTCSHFSQETCNVRYFIVKASRNPDFFDVGEWTIEQYNTMCSANNSYGVSAFKADAEARILVVDVLSSLLTAGGE